MSGTQKTAEFFPRDEIQWKQYPESKLTGSYCNHHVKFFTLPNEKAKQVFEFTQLLQTTGFKAKYAMTANRKPSVVLDLTASELKPK